MTLRCTTNESNEFSECKTRLFNAILDQTKLTGVLLWIRIEIISAVTLNLSIDSILIKLLCRFVNFVEMKKKFTKWFLKKIMRSFKSTASKIKTEFFFLNKSPNVILNKPPPCVTPRGGATRKGVRAPRPPSPGYSRFLVWKPKT